MRAAAKITVIVLATLAVLYALWYFRDVLALFVLALLLAAMLAPIDEFLIRHRVPPAAATALAYVGAVLVAASSWR